MMRPEDVPAELVEKGMRAMGMWSKRRDLGEQAVRDVLAAVLPDAGARLLEEFHENYDFFFNTRGEPVSAVASSDFTTEIARLRATTERKS